MKNANPLSWCLRFTFLVALGASVVSCSKPVQVQVEENAPASTYFPVTVSGKRVQMQLAISPGEMTHGLMGRKDLTSGQGMIFVYPELTQMSFYMRNTPTPLDIGYFDRSGALREIYQMYPFDERPVRSRTSDMQFALELKQGDFSALGIKIGDTLDLKALAAALKKRGYEPRKFSLDQE